MNFRDAFLFGGTNPTDGKKPKFNQKTRFLWGVAIFTELPPIKISN